MRVPETAVNENHRLQAWKYQVRLSGQILAVEAKPISKHVRNSAHDVFRRRVLATNGRHKPAAMCRS
jgi:hypothetical protein